MYENTYVVVWVGGDAAGAAGGAAARAAGGAAARAAGAIRS
jgi:hypothetical protein